MSSQPTGRFEWERIVRRIVMPERVKLVALLLSTFADGDGSRVRPGADAITAMVGKSKATMKRAMTVLRDELGLIEEVSRGGGGRASEYRLVVPEDLLERAELLDPDGKRSDNSAHSDEPSSGETQLTLVSPDPTGTPVDNSETGLTQLSPDDSVCKRNWAQIRPFANGTGLKSEATGLTQGEPPPLLIPTTKEDQNNSAPDATTTSARSHCEHGIRIRRRRDGTSNCAFCRRLNPPTAQEAS